MKTKQLSAIGLVVMAAVSAVGCGAENGQDEVPGGELRAPLVLADITAARARAASCVITDTDSIDKLIVFGGESATAVEVNDVYKYDPAANVWSTQDKTYRPIGGGAEQNLPVLTNAKLLAIPGTDQCLLTGGSDNGTASVKTFIYDLSANNWFETNDLAASREKFSLIQCGTGTVNDARILAIAGEDNGTFRNTVEVFTPTGLGGATPSGSWAQFGTTDTLVLARSNVAVASLDTNYTTIFVAGGSNAGNPTDDVDVLTATTACGTQNIDNFANELVVGREKAAAFPTGVSNEFYVVGGSSNGSNSLTSTEKCTLSFGPLSVACVAGTAMTTPRQNPQVARYATGFKRWAIVGGLDTTPNPDVELKKLQAWNGNASPATWAVEATFENARYEGMLEYLPSEGRMYFVGGQNVAGTISAKTESL